MKTLKCFENFKCIGGICPDNCCIGWEIGIDAETLQKYKEPPLYDFVKDKVDFSRSVIKLCDNGRCPFLNKDNLCDIIINYGYDRISYICKKHPSFINEVNGASEYGYGLCCDEALRLLINGEVYMENNSEDFLFSLRNELFNIVYDDSLSFREKVKVFLDKVCEGEDIYLFGESLSDASEDLPSYKASILPMLKIMEKTEPIDNEWTSRLETVLENAKEIEKNLDKICEKEKYKKLFYYYIFRYFLKDIDENSLLGNGKLIVILVLLNIIFDACSEAIGDNFNNTRLISKQMEYSLENIQLLIDEALENEAFEYENLIGIL